MRKMESSIMRPHLKLLLVIPNLYKGGAEYQLVELCRSLGAYPDVEFSVLVFYSEKARNLPGYYDVLKKLGVQVHCLFDSLVTGKPLLRALRQYFKTKNPDVVQSFLEANNYCVIASLRLKHDLYFGIRSMVNIGIGYRLLNNILSFRVNGYIGNAKAVTDFYCNQLRTVTHKRHVIYNGLDVQRFNSTRSRQEIRAELGLPLGARAFITVANMHFPFKGHAELVQAWCCHAPLHPNDWLLLVGDGKLRCALESAIQSAGLSGRTLFLGIRSDVADLLAMADVYVSPSWFEGCSNSILEAQLSGLPVIATAVGGTPEFVQDGPQGRLVAPRRSQEIADALAGQYFPSTETMKEQLRGKVGLDRLAQEYLRIYRA
jgi:glycosyltransferase involved in cell wall biosynthesis